MHVHDDEIGCCLRATMNKSTAPILVEVYDARGNGDGQTVCTLTGDHQSRVTDYTAIVVERIDADADRTVQQSE